MDTEVGSICDTICCDGEMSELELRQKVDEMVMMNEISLSTPKTDGRGCRTLGVACARRRSGIIHRYSTYYISTHVLYH